MAPVDVVLEEGRRRTFACALDWPGWARAGRNPQAALEALEDYRPRYEEVVSGAGAGIPVGRLRVVERLEGNATTDFGAPGMVAAADLRAIRPATRARLSRVLEASWAAFDRAVGASPRLRTGPRGGGRDAAKLWRHVTDAEVAYARAMGLSIPATNGEAAAVSSLHDELVGLVLGARSTDREPKWPLRYGVRRTAWHVLDHLFELEDRRVD